MELRGNIRLTANYGIAYRVTPPRPKTEGRSHALARRCELSSCSSLGADDDAAGPGCPASPSARGSAVVLRAWSGSTPASSYWYSMCYRTSRAARVRSPASSAPTIARCSARIRLDVVDHRGTWPTSAIVYS